MTSEFDVAIVGGGFCGSMVAVHLLNSRERPLSVALIERAPEIGLGLAYGTEDPQHLLNVIASRMSAFPDDPEHLLRWLAAQGIDAQPGSFIPRLVYGRYIKQIFAEALQASEGVHRFERIRAEVVGVDSAADRVTLVLKDDPRPLRAARAVLALGNVPPRAPAPFKPDQIKAMEFRAPRQRGESILIVGAGLTAVDAILTVSAANPNTAIYSLSRRGLAPRSHRPAPTELPDLSGMPKVGASLREALRAVRRVVAGLSDVESQWRVVIDSLRPHTQEFWQSFSPVEQRRFLRHLRPFWDVHRHRIAPQIAARLEELRTSDRLRYLGGYVTQVEEREGGFEVTVRKRRVGGDVRLQVGEILNCTGARFDTEVPLIRSLIEQGLAVPAQSQLGLKTDRQGALLQRDGSISQQIFTLGPPCLGDLWESIAVPELNGQAKRLAARVTARS